MGESDLVFCLDLVPLNDESGVFAPRFDLLEQGQVPDPLVFTAKRLG